MFDTRFQIVIADTEESKQIHYKLRCEIYCMDRTFENVREFEDQMEIDEVDSRSIHFLIREIETGEWIGTFRMVLPDHDRLPIEKHCDLKEEIMVNLPRTSIIEVSRLGIAKRFTQRSEGVNDNPSHLTSLVNSHSAVSNLREVSSGVLRAIWQFSIGKGIENILFFITPALARILLSMHIPLRQAGSPCTHKGKRYPYIIHQEKLRSTIETISSHEGHNFNSLTGYYSYSEFFNNENFCDLNYVTPTS